MSDKARRHYAEAGVDISATDQFASELANSLLQSAPSAADLSTPGFFASLFDLKLISSYEDPVLASSSDGVGTKLMLARQVQGQEQESYFMDLGQDLVAMCANDLLCTGAKPLFFLDYLATSNFDPKRMQAVIRGISAACHSLNCSLLGGETAQLPGLISQGHFDLAGFCVGVVERAKILGPHQVKEGQVLIGLAASGPHCNGFSLIRSVLPDLVEDVLIPTPLYGRVLYPILGAFPAAICALANITGGGLGDNLKRILPTNLEAEVHLDSWPRLAILEQIRFAAELSFEESLSVFNGGLGMILSCDPDYVEKTLAELHSAGTKAYKIGVIQARTGESKIIYR